jgi:hypothetical protein
MTGSTERHMGKRWAAGALLLLGVPLSISGQVTTATFYGIVTDPTGAGVPGATVILTHEGTNATATRTTDPTGEFVFDFLRIGSYTLRIEAKGFKRYESKGIELASGQTVRQAFALEVGALTETVTVEGSAPLVSTASAEQLQTFESIKVTELPLGRRNVSSLLRLASGVDIGANRNLRVNGLGSNTTGISVDGTDANAYPEQRGMAQYGARNYIDVMSIDAVQEVQLVRGVMPAEYGGVLAGQVNVISRSGTNELHGSAFENYQSHVLNARNPFVAARTASGAMIPKPRIVYNQFGGSIGGPVIRDRAFFFGAYEGYRESASRRVTATVPTQSFRNEILRALPYEEMKILLGILPLPNVPINEDVGRFEGVRNALSRENHVVAKGDVRLSSMSNLAVTYTRMRPFGLDPTATVDGANDRTYEYVQDRVAASFTIGGANWTSESRFGYNFSDMARLDRFFTRKDPSGKAEIAPWDRSIPRISVSGPSGFGAGAAEIWDMDGTTYSFDQKVARHSGRHSVKFGMRYVFYGGFRSNPENPAFSFQNKADFLANVPSQVTPTFGSPPYKSAMHELGFFAQDDWRVSPKLVLNLGLRYDFYSHNVSKPTGQVPVGFFNPEPPKDWSKLDFGPYRDPNNPYENDGWVNLGPRFGFAFNPDGQSKTVFRGGFAVLFSPQMPGAMRQAVAHPVVPFRVRFSLDEARQFNLKFPRYTDELRTLVEQQNARTGIRFPFSAFNPGLQNPYAMHYQFNIQRALGQTLMFETGYVGVRGVKFLLHRRVNLPDRLTGIRPNPNIIFGGPYYVDHSQNTTYNGWQSSLRKRFSTGLAFDAHYTWGKGLGVTGGDIGAYYGSDPAINIQEFNNPRADRGPNAGDATHRFQADWIYDLPWLSRATNPLLRNVVGGWQVAGIVSARSGEPVTITQSCASEWHCRPDYVGGPVIHNNWKENATTRCVVGGRCSIQYINRAAFARVPVDPRTRIAIRPGNVGVGTIRNPATWTIDFALSKNIKLRERINLQLRADAFNVLNHVNYGSPAAGIDGATFGEINGIAGSMRVVQLNARLSW